MKDIELYEAWCEYNNNNLPISFAEFVYQQGRADAIDEFANKIKEYSGEHYLDCDGYGCQTELVFRTEDRLDDIVEQLKEQRV